MKKLILFCSVLLLSFLLSCEKDALGDLGAPDEITVDERRPVPAYFPDVIDLPEGFGVEGIEVGRDNNFFVSSWTVGGIYKGNLKSGEGAMLVGPNGIAMAGLSYDHRTDYLFAAASWNGTAMVFRGATGELVATYDLAAKAGDQLGPQGALINDVIVTQYAAYFTDSYNPILYKLPLGRGGELPDLIDVEVIEMDGFVMTYDPSFYLIEANGIVSTSALGRKLIVNNMATGIFYLVDTQSGDATPIDITGKTPDELVWGDGLLLMRHTLYIARNFPNEIVAIELSDDFTSGQWVKDITMPALAEPATLARNGNTVYACNAHFYDIYILGIDPNTLPYEVVKVE